MDSVMIQDCNRWNRSSLLFDEEEQCRMTAPPPTSPQDPSVLEAVFSQRLSAKIHTVILHANHDEMKDHTLHARTLEKLLKSKRPSRIPILSSRIHKKRLQHTSSKQDSSSSLLSKALDRIHLNPGEKKEKKLDIMIQDLKDMSLL